MTPDDNSIRAVLRQDAARVPIPQEMWVKINQRLDEEIEAEDRIEHVQRSRHDRPVLTWRPVLAISILAGLFGFAVFPGGQRSHQAPPPEPPSSDHVAIDPSLQDIPVDLRAKWAPTPTLPKTTVAGAEGPAPLGRHHGTVVE